MKNTTLSQSPLSFLGNLSFFPSQDKTIAGNNINLGSGFLLKNNEEDNARILHENVVGKTIGFIPCFVNEAKSYATPNYTPLAFSLLTQNNSLETTIVGKLEKIDKVKKVYMDEDEQFTDIKIILEMNTYDYDLVDKILKEVEFPIKDEFKNKLIDFEYLPFIEKEDDDIYNGTNWKLIFSRNISEIVFSPNNDFNYEKPLNNIPLVNVAFL